MASRKPAQGKRRKGDLPETVQIAIGAKVLVTQNIETDLDIANGTRAEIVDIILDEREPAIDDNAVVVELKYPPAGILVKLKKTRLKRLAGLDERVVPIRPLCRPSIPLHAHTLSPITARRGRRLPVFSPTSQSRQADG
ncbi:hypothetical protein BDZ89DRAFT_1070937 [Hymenopellis radicata]|nr:hypothetical protein BDZ89DRAFT_1070937 [Hymenopellis radicata]